jgi:ribonuclease HI
MNAQAPRYLLFSQLEDETKPGHWRFVLRAADGSHRLEASDVEPEVRGERLELLTVARGLEALDRPARVTLVTSSAYVSEGIRRSLSEWRKNGWRWERFGLMVPVKNLDLWQRIDRAMRYHEVDCRTYRFDPPHSVDLVKNHQPARELAGAPAAALPLQYGVPRFAPGLRGWLLAGLQRLMSKLQEAIA